MRLSSSRPCSCSHDRADGAPAEVRQAQPARDDPGYYFLLGRSLESEGKIDEAIAAHKRAIALEPESAELRAELAGVYARQDSALDAVETAEAALKLDTANLEANRILGIRLRRARRAAHAAAPRRRRRRSIRRRRSPRSRKRRGRRATSG